MAVCGTTCDMNYVDLDPAVAGCECMIDTAAIPDVPDPATTSPAAVFRDTNCDGVDGDLTKAIWVDELGNEKEMRALVKTLPHSTLHVVKGGDHSLALPKKEGKDAQEAALEGAAEAILAFVKRARRSGP